MSNLFGAPRQGVRKLSMWGQIFGPSRHLPPFVVKGAELGELTAELESERQIQAEAAREVEELLDAAI